LAFVAPYLLELKRKKIVPCKIRAKPIILEIALISGFGVRRDLRFCEKGVSKSGMRRGSSVLTLTQSSKKGVALAGEVLLIVIVGVLVALSVSRFTDASNRAKAVEPSRVIGAYESSRLADYVKKSGGIGI
jgi:hypothetical protein